MATQNQIEANRRNAQKSTGPRSVEGKAVSRFNALKTGITAQSMVIPGEDPAELDTLAAEYHDQFQPATALERFLVDALTAADWQLRRLRRVEAQFWSNEITETKGSFRGLNENAPLGHVFGRSNRAFLLLQRRIDSTERSYYRALTQLQRLQGPERPAPELPDPQPIEPAPDSPELASFSTILSDPSAPPPAPFESPVSCYRPHS